MKTIKLMALAILFSLMSCSVDEDIKEPTTVIPPRITFEVPPTISCYTMTFVYVEQNTNTTFYSFNYYYDITYENGQVVRIVKSTPIPQNQLNVLICN